MTGMTTPLITIPCEIKKQIKPLKLTYNWLKLNKRLENSEVLKALKSTGVVLNLLDVPKKVGGYSKLKGGFVERSVRASNLTAGLIGIAGATLKFGQENEVISLSSKVLVVLDCVGLVASFTLVVKTIFDLIRLFTNPSKSHLIFSFDLFLKVSKLAVGVLGLITFTTGLTLVGKSFLLLISSSSLVIGNYKSVYKDVLVQK